MRVKLLLALGNAYLWLSRRLLQTGPVDERLLTLIRELGPDVRGHDLWRAYNERFEPHVSLGRLYLALEKLELLEQVRARTTPRSPGSTRVASTERRSTAVGPPP